ncbi:MAG: Hsp70 family protein, partial [Limisphaerales bacterium]
LEQSLGPREEWRVPVLRELWSVVFAGAARRRRSAEHERVFFQLLGYTLRPGFGYPLDDWRCEQSLRLFTEGVQSHKEKAVWKDFWILWRRVCGGLNEQAHYEIWRHLQPYLAARIPLAPAKNLPRPKGVQPEGLDEMLRLAASLEHLGADDKSQMGEWILSRLQEPKTASGPWAWSLGRLGARVPIYGSVHKVLDPDRAAAWVRLLLEPSMLRLDGALFALAQLARLTGDRTRDLPESARLEAAKALSVANASPSWQRMVTEIVALDTVDRARALGDTLPVGLVLD